MLLSWQQLNASSLPINEDIVTASPHAIQPHTLTPITLHANQSLFSTAAGLSSLIDDALSEDAGFDAIQIDIADLSEIDIDKILQPSLSYMLPAAVQVHARHYHHPYIFWLAFWLDKPPQSL